MMGKPIGNWSSYEGQLTEVQSGLESEVQPQTVPSSYKLTKWIDKKNGANKRK